MMQGPERTRMRLAILGMLVLSMLSVIVLRLWFLQVLAHDVYVDAAENNQLRIVPVEPARGRILDRNGEVLVRNRPSLVVAVRMDELGDRKDDVLNRLAGLLEITREELDQRLADKRVLPYTPIPVKEDVPEETIWYLKEHQAEFPGVVTEVRPVRVYPNGALGAHLLGYTGEITSEQLNDPRYEGYRQGAIIGKNGLEQSYESVLRGRDGAVKLEVNSSGRVLRTLSSLEPRPGKDLVTSISIPIQKVTEESLHLGILKAREIFDRERGKNYLAPGGSALVMDVRSGEIIAMASYPTYDPTLFVGGISHGEFDRLNKDPAKPLLNRPIQAEFPPGSTFKVVTAAAALQDGLATRNGRYRCPPSYRFGDTTFRNWKSTDSGAISLAQSLIESCDTVFYDFGAEFWRRFRAGQGERLQDYARAFGVDAPTQIDIPFEKDGRVPDEAWLKEMNARYPQAFPYRIWLPGYTINMSIGQGDLIMTPLQQANMFAAITNGGNLVKPHVGMKVMDGTKVVEEIKPEPLAKVPVSPANLETILQGLEGVVTSGTARATFASFPLDKVPVGGKTGTAELQTVPPKQPYAWFAAYAPANDPKYVVVVMLEEGGHGGETAAPIARRIIEALFDLPLSSLETGVRTD